MFKILNPIGGAANSSPALIAWIASLACYAPLAHSEVPLGTVTINIIVELPAKVDKKSPVAGFFMDPPTSSIETLDGHFALPATKRGTINHIPTGDSVLCPGTSCQGERPTDTISAGLEDYTQIREILALSSRLYILGQTSDYTIKKKILLVLPLDVGFFGSLSGQNLDCRTDGNPLTCTLEIDMSSDQSAVARYQKLTQYADADGLVALSERLFVAAQARPLSSQSPASPIPK